MFFRGQLAILMTRTITPALQRRYTGQDGVINALWTTAPTVTCGRRASTRWRCWGLPVFEPDSFAASLPSFEPGSFAGSSFSGSVPGFEPDSFSGSVPGFGPFDFDSADFEALDLNFEDFDLRDLHLSVEDLGSAGGSGPSQRGAKGEVGAWPEPQPSALASSLRSALASLPDPYPRDETEVRQLQRELFEEPTLSRGQLAVLMTKAATPPLRGRYPGESPVGNSCPVDGCPKTWTGPIHAGQQARHIHKCYKDKLIDSVLVAWTKLLNLDLSKCPMKSCRQVNFASASDLSTHLGVNHRKVVPCQVEMPDGTICGHIPSTVYNDVPEHRELVHGLIDKRTRTTRPDIVHYCETCHLWLKGRFAVQEHAEGHLPQLLQELEHDPGCLSGSRTGKVPSICPFCLVDAALSPGQRGSAYADRATLRDHIS